LIERSNKKDVDEKTLASFEISHNLWQRFRARCIEHDMTTAEVLSQLIADYLDETGESSPGSLDELLTEKVQKTVQQYLEQNLDLQLLQNLENRLEQLIQQSIENHLNSNVSETSSSPPSVEPPQASPPQPKTNVPILKTAKELGDILGVSAPYITTLNRIGELQQRGWEDSGKRRGKTILYKPIDQ
jgi:hypothetical protein